MYGSMPRLLGPTQSLNLENTTKLDITRNLEKTTNLDITRNLEKTTNLENITNLENTKNLYGSKKPSPPQVLLKL